MYESNELGRHVFVKDIVFAIFNQLLSVDFNNHFGINPDFLFLKISSLKPVFKHRDAILKKQPDEVLRIEDANHVIVFDSADS